MSVVTKRGSEEGPGTSPPTSEGWGERGPSEGKSEASPPSFPPPPPHNKPPIHSTESSGPPGKPLGLSKDSDTKAPEGRGPCGTESEAEVRGQGKGEHMMTC